MASSPQWRALLRTTAALLRQGRLLGGEAAALSGPLSPQATPASRAFAAEAAAAGAPAARGQPHFPVPTQFSLAGRVEGRYRVERGSTFAVVEVGGTQFKVSPDDLIYSERLRGVDVSDKVSLNRVLMVGSTSETLLGRPYVPGASVTAAVEEQFLDAKVIIFKKRRRKNSRRTKGHRQPLTALRIVDIVGL